MALKLGTADAGFGGADKAFLGSNQVWPSAAAPITVEYLGFGYDETSHQGGELLALAVPTESVTADDMLFITVSAEISAGNTIDEIRLGSDTGEEFTIVAQALSPSGSASGATAVAYIEGAYVAGLDAIDVYVTVNNSATVNRGAAAGYRVVGGSGRTALRSVATDWNYGEPSISVNVDFAGGFLIAAYAHGSDRACTWYGVDQSVEASFFSTGSELQHAYDLREGYGTASHTVTVDHGNANTPGDSLCVVVLEEF